MARVIMTADSNCTVCKGTGRITWQEANWGPGGPRYGGPPPPKVTRTRICTCVRAGDHETAEVGGE